MNTDFQNGRRIAELERKLNDYYDEVIASLNPRDKSLDLRPLVDDAFEEYSTLAQQYGVPESESMHVKNLYGKLKSCREYRKKVV